MWAGFRPLRKNDNVPLTHKVLISVKILLNKMCSECDNDNNNDNFYLAHSNNLQKGKLMYNYNNKGIAWKRTGLGVQILIGTF